MFNEILTKIFGSSNDRLLKGYWLIVEKINLFETDIKKLTDAQLRAKTDEFKERLLKR